ncbi:MAG: DUF4190 domain-containing protein [Verrucomicrobia bacterium]|nr:DUF4190 domain-containing protein [Verrucomicrobiota bacterium]
MANEWFYANDEKQQVPISEKNLKQLAADKLITRQCLVWNSDLPDWQPCGTLHPEWFLDELGSAAPPKLPKHIKPGTNKPAHPLAIASLICGLSSLLPLGCLGLLGIIFLPVAIAAVICGHMALKKIRHAENNLDGKSIAIAGLVTGYLSLGTITLLAALFGLVYLIPDVIPPKIDEASSSPAPAIRPSSPEPPAE